MSLSLESLLTPSTEDESLQLILDILESLNFNTTSWQDGSRQRTLIQLLARVHSNLTTTVSKIAAGVYNGLATGTYLKILSESFFQNFKVQAQVTIGTFHLASSATAPPHTIAAGDLQIATTPTMIEGVTQTYRNTTGDTLNTGSFIDLTFESEVAGAAGNIPNNTTLYMWTPLVGVTVTNPPVGSSGSWVTTAGLDEESDPRLTQRNVDKWGTLSYASSDGAYRFWAMTIEPTVTRVKVRSNNPFGPGTVDVVCATATGGITALQAQAILDYINGTDGVGRRPLNDIVSVQSALSSNPVMAFTAKVLTSFQTTNVLLITETIQSYLGELDIGGAIIPPSSTGVVVMSEIIERVMALPGMVNFTANNPVDIPLGPLDVVTSTPSITLQYV